MSDLMLEALNLALYGMGTVFSFLTALVILTALMSKLVSAFSEPEVEELTTGARLQPQTSQVSPILLAAITGAVKQYRERH
ncbi:MAG: oxaloacetate decarboxylase gamma subunit [Patiriisocius sp.]|jgi:oxaloacetate decarboxylase gamma subunit